MPGRGQEEEDQAKEYLANGSILERTKGKIVKLNKLTLKQLLFFFHDVWDTALKMGDFLSLCDEAARFPSLEMNTLM